MLLQKMNSIENTSSEESSSFKECSNRNLENFAIEFFSNAYFGCYPTSESLKILEDCDFNFIIKLTCEPERNIHSYVTKLNVLHFPIKDNNIPVDWETFSMFICLIVEYIKQDKKIFIHCKGGHGRSCVVVACILYLLHYEMNAREAIEKTINIHNHRNAAPLRDV